MKKIAFTAAAVLLAAVILFVIVELRLKGLRNKFAEIEANIAAGSAMTQGLDETLAQYKLSYDDVVDFTYDSGGNIKSLSVDIITMNTFGNELGKNIDRNISEIENHRYELPVSLLFGEEFLSGIGFKIPFYVTMKGNSSSKFTDLFESAGVNQTRHKIMIETTIEMYVLFGGNVRTVVYHSNVCVAESIIIGVTPQTFANF